MTQYDSIVYLLVKMSMDLDAIAIGVGKANYNGTKISFRSSFYTPKQALADCISDLKAIQNKLEEAEKIED